jgi:diaminopimelate epimerase
VSASPTIPFWKVVSIGNDFVLVRLEDVEPEALPSLSRAACIRRTSVGADGLLAVGREEGDLRMRMFNPDGTEDFCGNGLRAAGLWAVRQGWTGPDLAIRHQGALVACSVSGDEVETVLPGASFAPSRVPLSLAGELFARDVAWPGGARRVSSALTTGSAHTVLFCDLPPPPGEVETLGPMIEHHPWFPERTSVIWAWPEADGLAIRIWERGAGETQGCGTGSAAATVAWFRLHGRAGTMAVRNPGGDVQVEMARWDAPMRLRSTAAVVYEGALARSLISRS